MRICSLFPGATEIAFALGLADEIVGVSHECDFPAAARGKPVLIRSAIDAAALNSAEIDRQVRETVKAGGDLYALDEEKLRELEPDLILTQGLCDVCALDYDQVVGAARSLARPARILTLNPNGLADVIADIVRVGAATGREAQAGKLVEALQNRIQAVRDRSAAPGARPRVACLEWLEPLYAAGHWVPEMVETAGGIDVLASPGQPSIRISRERLAESSPDILVLMPCGFDTVRTVAQSELLTGLSGWSELPAVRRGNVFAVSANDHFSRPGPRLVDGLEILSYIFHPELSPASLPRHFVRKIITASSTLPDAER